ncbi:uncharacterized protein FTOL_13667 [Fusarium torulosum]|uniref:Uncharacterized protein n=1 Tax=Fusarium torulosum TaxID=33205 RepID=A0AAE8SQ27_9HYPO|nr:uncharacterized protein FTOL_13667 [Fusarium torulosum]
MDAGQQLQNPVTSSEPRPTPGDDTARVWTLLSKALRYPNDYPVAGIVKSFYDSTAFNIQEFNSLLGEDGEELKLSSKVSWGELDLEQKQYIGQMCYQRKLIFQD